MQGSLSASLDQINWVLTSYIVASRDHDRANRMGSRPVRAQTLVRDLPTLGARLTENYNWHWVFLINLPIGIVTVLGLMVFMPETPGKPDGASTGSVLWHSP
jgi:hypothetical protein